MIYNRIPVTFNGQRSVTGPLVSYQYDEYQILVISGIELPEYYEVDFCNEGDLSTTTMIGTADGVLIPNAYLRTGKKVKAYIVVRGEESGAVETRYEITLPVRIRPAREDIDPTPAEQDQIDEILDILNDAVIMAMPPAGESGQVLAKRSNDDYDTEWVDQPGGGGGGGLTPTASELLLTILEEAVYGSDQSNNIALLREELLTLIPVSISANYNGSPAVGTPYSSIYYDVSVTYSDGSHATVIDYEVVTEGNVVSGTNTVTISYEGLTTTCTFTASEVTTYTVTYNLTHVSSSSSASSVESGSYYNTVLTVDTDYNLDAVTVTMGGVDVTSTVYGNLEILITAVTGNVVITATATQVAYLDPLLRNYNYWTFVYAYSDDKQTQVISSSNNTTATTEYPALNNCTLHWEIKNVSDSAITTVNLGFGQIDSYASDYRPDYAKIDISYFVAASTQSGTLAPGASIEGTYSLAAGCQLVFTCKYDLYSSYELKITGDYVPNTFAGYSDLALSKSLPNYGSYRTITWYSDDGTTQIRSGASSSFKKVTDELDAGTYDVWYCMATDAARIVNDVVRSDMVIGGVDNNTVTSVYYAYAPPVEYNAVNLWYHGQFTIAEGQTVIANLTGNPNETTENWTLKIKKVVEP